MKHLQRAWSRRLLAGVILVQACAAESSAPEPLRVKRPQGPVYEEEAIPGFSFIDGRCAVDTGFKREVAFDETTTLGFSANDVIATFNALAHGTLTWTEGATTQIDFHAEGAATAASCLDPPHDRGYCAPSFDIPLRSLTIRSSDGVLNVRLTPEIVEPESLDLVATSDGRGGIGVIFLSALSLSPALADSALLRDAAAAHPDHVGRSIRPTFSLSTVGLKASCLDGMLMSSDPSENCNIYDGVLSYFSQGLSLSAEQEAMGASRFYSAQLATWFWTP